MDSPRFELVHADRKDCALASGEAPAAPAPGPGLAPSPVPEDEPSSSGTRPCPAPKKPRVCTQYNDTRVTATDAPT